MTDTFADLVIPVDCLRDNYAYLIRVGANDVFVVDPGDQICVPITVQDFENIEQMQFSVAWDNSILSYSNTQNVAIPGITFDESFQSFGGLCLSWDGGGTTESLPDGSTLFEVCFDAIGGPFTCSEISFPQFPCIQEVITSESNGFSVDINGQAGEVCMENPNSFQMVEIPVLSF